MYVQYLVLQSAQATYTDKTRPFVRNGLRLCYSRRGIPTAHFLNE